MMFASKMDLSGLEVCQTWFLARVHKDRETKFKPRIETKRVAKPKKQMVEPLGQSMTRERTSEYPLELRRVAIARRV